MRWKALLVWVVAMLAACGGKSVVSVGADGGDDSGATGGTAPTGGTGVATGGNAVGGASGGLGGAAATGDFPGQAGLPGHANCLPDTATPLMEFYNDIEGWSVTSSEFDIGGSTLVDPSAIELYWISADGWPNFGVMVASIPYSMPSQRVGLGANLGRPTDLSDAVLTLCVRVVEGFGDSTDLMTSPGGAKLYAKSGAGSCYANGQYHYIGDAANPRGRWMKLQFNLARPPDYEDPNCVEPFDPTDVREIGVELDTSPTTRTAQPAAFMIDTLATFPY
jgi:hypothetical protein